jgi:hypothetical protein
MKLVSIAITALPEGNAELLVRKSPTSSVHTQAEIADGTKPFITVGKPGYKRKSWDT